jgi:hypothetical protein
MIAVEEKMCRSIYSVACYLAACLLVIFLLFNLFSLVELGVFSFLPLYLQRALYLLFLGAYTLLCVLPFLITPFPVIAKALDPRKSISLSELIKATPRAYLRALKSCAHASFSLLVVGFPLCIGLGVLLRVFVSDGMLSAQFCFALAVNALVFGLLGQQIVTRLLYPIVKLLSDRSPIEALSLTFELVDLRALWSVFTFVSTLVFLLALCYVAPIAIPELLSLVDGSVLRDSASVRWGVLFQLLPYLVFGAGLLMVVSLRMADTIAIRGRNRLKSLLDANVSPYYISKLARAGYFD